MMIFSCFSIGTGNCPKLRFLPELHFNLEPIRNLATQVFGDLYFLDDSSYINPIFHRKKTTCNLCPTQTNSTMSDSTDRDLAMGVLYGDHTYNVLTWVRNLRSVGCKATIVFFVTKEYMKVLTQLEIENLYNCGVFMFFFTQFDPNKIRELRYAKNLIYPLFLNSYGQFFDRVLINDIYDSIFQKDPFLKTLNRNEIAVSIERVRIKYHDWFQQRLRSMDPQYSIEFYGSKFIINSGFFIGGSKTMLSLFSNITDPQYMLKYDSNDQAILNMLYYRNIFPNLKVDLEGENYLSACYSVFEENPDQDGFMHEIGYPHKLSVIHQYDRICHLVQQISRVCPSLGQDHHYPSGRPNYIMQKCGSKTSVNNPPKD